MTKSEPNVVPLCDILLVLLIIFMVATPVTEAGIDVNLPNKGEPPDKRKTPVVLTIDKDGLLSLNKETFTDLESLKKRLIEIYRYRNERIIFVNMHPDHSYKYFIEIADIIKGAGVEKICTYRE